MERGPMKWKCLQHNPTPNNLESDQADQEFVGRHERIQDRCSRIVLGLIGVSQELKGKGVDAQENPSPSSVTRG